LVNLRGGVVHPLRNGTSHDCPSCYAAPLDTAPPLTPAHVPRHRPRAHPVRDRAVECAPVAHARRAHTPPIAIHPR